MFSCSYFLQFLLNFFVQRGSRYFSQLSDIWVCFLFFFFCNCCVTWLLLNGLHLSCFCTLLEGRPRLVQRKQPSFKTHLLTQGTSCGRLPSCFMCFSLHFAKQLNAGLHVSLFMNPVLLRVKLPRWLLQIPSARSGLPGTSRSERTALAQFCVDCY